jgi:hypothetical protein
LADVLTECAWAAEKTKGTSWSEAVTQFPAPTPLLDVGLLLVDQLTVSDPPRLLIGEGQLVPREDLEVRGGGKVA